MWLLLAVAVLLRAVGAAGQERFTEEALISPLPNGLVLVHLQFTSTAPHRRHYTLFPKAVGQLAAAIPFNQLELSLSQGRWHYSKWGVPPVTIKPAGAELRAWLAPSLAAASDRLWASLSQALGGLFCASLNFVARPEATARQAIHMVPQCATSAAGAAADTVKGGGSSSSSSSNHSVCEGSSCLWAPAAASDVVLYAALPQEASCTENLTPWLKLLPCRDAAGLGQLLANREVVFSADYHSMQVQLHVERDAQQQPVRSTLTQSMTLVLRPPSSSSSSSRWRHVPNPGSVFTVQLSRLLGSRLTAACPVAQHSRLYLRLAQQQQQQALPLTLEVPGPAAGEAAAAATAEAAAAAAVAADEGEGTADGEHAAAAAVTVRGSLEAEEAQGSPGLLPGAVQCRRAAGWTTAAFTLSPAPDAAITFTPRLIKQQQQEQQQQQQGAEAGHSSSSSSSSSSSTSHVLYLYDLAAEGSCKSQQGGGTGAASDQQQQQLNLTWSQAAAAAGAGGAPYLSVTRFITGTGNLHGGMVLEVEAATPTPGGAAAAAAGRSTGSVSLCIFQVVPWYIRLWLHTLQLSIDGQLVQLSDHLLLRHVQSAADRVQPLVLELCLAVPAAAQRISLSTHFTKAFLAMAEHPPDAHRGFDVPAAIITIAGAPTHTNNRAAAGPLLEQQQQQQSGGLAAVVRGCGGNSWQVHAMGGGGGGGAAAAAAEEDWLSTATPLMVQLSQPVPQQVYSPGLVVPLAVPDFSMPYNVVCLTSTVLAVFFGALLNTLLQRPGKEERVQAAGEEAARQLRRHKMLKLAAVLVVFAALGLYLDPALQEQLEELLGSSSQAAAGVVAGVPAS